MSETKLDPRDRLAVMVSMAGSYIESGRGDDALAVMRTVAEDVATEIARLTRELLEAECALIEERAVVEHLHRELAEAREREREYRHVLISLTFDDRAGIASTEFGSHCLYCLWDSADLDPTIVHDDDCPVKAGRRVLAAYVHGGPRWLTRTARRGEGGGE